MLLPLFEEMRLFLSPGQSGYVRMRRGFRSRVLESGRATTVADALGNIAARGKGRRLRVRSYLSGHYARVLLLPWQPGLENEKEWSAYAQHAFDTAFGSSPDRQIRLARQGYGQPVIAAAIESKLQQEIEAAVTSAGAVPTSMEPYCSAAFDLHRGALGGSCWFFAAEPGMVTGMRLEEGSLKSIAMLPLESEMQASLAATIARELAKHSDAGGSNTVFVHATVPVGLSREELPGVDVRFLAAGHDEAMGIAS